MPASALAAIAATYLLAALAVLGARKPGYRHLANTISEIGETGSPDQRIVALGVFLPIGVAMLIVAVLARATSPVSALAITIAVGYLGAAAFPCDAGSPVSGSARQSLHNLAGAVEYIGGGFALMTLARDLGAPFQVAGVIVLVSAIALTLLASTSIRGLIQRIAEACLFGGLVYAAWLTRA
jgi:hypothetical membrane protein